MCEQTLLRVGAGVPHPETSSEHNLRFSSQNLQKFDSSSAPQTPTSPGPGPDGDRIHQQPDAMDEGLHTPDFGLAGRHSSPPSTAMGAQVRPGDQAQAAEMSLTRSHQSSDSDELASAATDVSNPCDRRERRRKEPKLNKPPLRSPIRSHAKTISVNTVAISSTTIKSIMHSLIHTDQACSRGS